VVQKKEPEPKENSKLYSNFQMRLKGATKSIDDLIASIDDDNREFKGEIDVCYKELDKIALERRQKALPMVPGE